MTGLVKSRRQARSASALAASLVLESKVRTTVRSVWTLLTAPKPRRWSASSVLLPSGSLTPFLSPILILARNIPGASVFAQRLPVDKAGGALLHTSAAAHADVHHDGRGQEDAA